MITQFTISDRQDHDNPDYLLTDKTMITQFTNRQDHDNPVY